MRRLLLSPSWVLRHLLAIALIALFVRLGWWQLVKGQSERGTMQNLFYGLEWPIFAGTVVFFWWKMVREELRPSSRPAPPTERGTIAPTSAAQAGAGQAGAGPGRATQGVSADGGSPSPGRAGADPDPPDDEDLELAAYNRYLASLYEHGSHGGRR